MTTMIPYEVEVASNMKALRPLNDTGEKPFRYAVFDIESNNWTDFELLGFYDGEQYREFYSVQDFLEFFMKRRYAYWRIFAHAGGRFDFNFIIESLDLDFSDFKYDILSNNGITQLRVMKDKRVWIFRDSYRMLPMSLAKLTVSFDTQHKKLEIAYANLSKHDEKLRQYLKNDCLGLYEVIQKYAEWLSKYNVPLYSTIASQSMAMYRTTMEKPIICLKPLVEKFARRSYFGGRVEIFKMRSFKPVKYFDFNSLYPTIMVNNEMPIGKGWHVSYFNRNFIGFYKATVKIPDVYVPPLPFLRGKKLLFPVGKVEGYFSSKELELVEEMGGEADVHYGYVFSSDNIFHDYIMDLYDKKKNAPDTTTRTISKLLMNSCYGKFGQKREKSKLVKCNTEEEALGLEPYHADRGLFTKQTVSKASFIIPSIASWVTSCARVELFKLLQRIGSEHIFYCDTDSCMADVDIKTGKELGEVKLEEEGDEAIFLLPKLYAIRKGDDVIIKAKGFDHDFIKKLSFHSFEKALDGDVSDFKQQMRKFASVRESLRQNGTFVSMVSKTKSIKSGYDKRKIISDYDTKAWKIK
jgi:hypothetical protein